MTVFMVYLLVYHGIKAMLGHHHKTVNQHSLHAVFCVVHPYFVTSGMEAVVYGLIIIWGAPWNLVFFHPILHSKQRSVKLSSHLSHGQPTLVVKLS